MTDEQIKERLEYLEKHFYDVQKQSLALKLLLLDLISNTYPYPNEEQTNIRLTLIMQRIELLLKEQDINWYFALTKLFPDLFQKVKQKKYTNDVKEQRE